MDWLAALTAVEILGGLSALGVLGMSLKWVVPILTGLRDFLADWKGEPARPGVEARPGVPERMKTIEDEQRRQSGDLSAVRTQMEAVTSLHADIEKMRHQIAEFQHAVEASAEDRKSLRLQAEELRRETADLARRVDALEQATWPERVIPPGPIDNP